MVRLGRIWAAGIALAAWGVLAIQALGFGGPLAYDLDGLAHLRLHLIGVAAVLALLAHGWAGRGAALAAVGLGLAGLGPVWAPLPQGVPGGPSLTVLFANTYARNTDLDGVTQALLGADADVVVIVEGPGALRKPSPLIDARYPTRLLPVFRRQSLGIQVWSRLAIEAVPPREDDPDYPVALLLRITVAPGAGLDLAALHFGHPWRGGLQERQVAAMAPLLAGRSGPRAVIGDFNAASWSHALAEVGRRTGTAVVGGLRLSWQGTHRARGMRISEPLGLPIDNLLVSPDVAVEDIRLVPIPGSDHQGLLARLRLPPG